MRARASRGQAPLGEVGAFRSYSTDPTIRRAKARKIVATLERHVGLSGARLLEVGVGSGQMTPVFVDAVGADGEVVGVDVVDVRLDDPGTEFRLLDGTDLPFAADRFDVVVSNHVIEHVGSAGDQLDHLRQMQAVLGADGWAYLATPSRWAPIEPHYRLPLLSWLPPQWRDPFVRAARRGEEFDIQPLRPVEIDRLAAESGFEVHDETATAMRLLASTEPDHRAAPVIRSIPSWCDGWLGRVMPTQVRLLRTRG